MDPNIQLSLAYIRLKALSLSPLLYSLFVFFNLQIDKFKMQRQSRREMPQTHREADELTDRLINARDNNSLHNTNRIKTDRLTISKIVEKDFDECGLLPNFIVSKRFLTIFFLICLIGMTLRTIIKKKKIRNFFF